MVWTIWLKSNTMSGPQGRLTYANMVFIGIVLEGFCFGEIVCLAVIICIINYSCPGLYSAVFFIYLQYHISKELSTEKRSIFLYLLGVQYTLSSVIVALDVTGQVGVSTTCILHNNISLYTFIRAEPPSCSSRTPPLPYGSDNNRPM